MKFVRSLLVFVAALAIAASAGYVGYVFGLTGRLPGKTEPAQGENQKDKDQGKDKAHGEDHDKDKDKKEDKAHEEDKDKEGKVAPVRAAPAQRAQMSTTVTAYGTVVATPEETVILSVPFESRVRRVLVVAGQRVWANLDMIEVEPSPEAQLQLQEARNLGESAAKDLAQAKIRLEMKLATSQEVRLAEQALQTARVRLESLEKRKIEARRIQAETPGVVSRIDVQEGQIVPAGGSLMALVGENHIQVRLGVDPKDMGELRPGQAVRITPVQWKLPAPVEGSLRLITRKVNPTSRLVDVFVSLKEPSPLLLDAYVQGSIAIASRPALVVPRSAVLTDEDKHVLFTVQEGKAVRHEIEIGLEDDQRVEIVGDAIQAGQGVVIEGNYELEDGMAVQVQSEEKEGKSPAKAGKGEDQDNGKAGEKAGEKGSEKGSAKAEGKS